MPKPWDFCKMCDASSEVIKALEKRGWKLEENLCGQFRLAKRDHHLSISVYWDSFGPRAKVMVRHGREVIANNIHDRLTKAVLNEYLVLTEVDVWLGY